ncbi:MAG: hypothetical protein ACJAU0_001235 [Flavobacteriales bacterium]|jgi:hypothetical protein
MDFNEYPEWNPFIRRISGPTKVGDNLQVELHQVKGKPMVISPEVVIVEPNSLFAWKGKFGVKGIFDGQHSFALEVLGKGETNFIHSEEFGGILLPFMRKMIKTTTTESFKLMNTALKARCEQA